MKARVRLAGLLSLPRRYYRPYLRSVLPGGSPLSVHLPWWTFGAIEWLEGWLGPNHQAFEWGSGGSTVFLAERVGKVVSIEHEPAWCTQVNAALGPQLSRRVELRLIPAPPRPGPIPPYGAGSHSSASRGFEGLDFTAYVQAIDAEPQGRFDLVAVDGRARASCLVQAMSRIRPGGWLLLDDSASPTYAEVIRRVDAWAKERRDWPGWMPSNRYRGRLYAGQTSAWRAPDAP